MASTKKTSILGLNLWSETDKPERLDFVSDNEKLEELVGAHIKSANIHLTETEKDRARTPYTIFSFIGDGKASRVYNLSFEPRIFFLFAVNRPDGITENGLHSVFRVMKFGSYTTPGVTISGVKATFKQQTEAEAIAEGTGYRLRMNESGVTYSGVIFK